MDLNLLFDIGEGLNKCKLPHDRIEYEFENYGHDYMQIVLSERVPNCFFAALEEQNWFKFEDINTKWI